MGAIKKIIDDIDPSTDVLKEQKELLESLSKLADAKADFFALEMEKNLTQAGTANLTVPVEAVIATIRQTHAYSSASAAEIGTTVSDAITEIFSSHTFFRTELEG